MRGPNPARGPPAHFVRGVTRTFQGMRALAQGRSGSGLLLPTTRAPVPGPPPLHSLAAGRRARPIRPRGQPPGSCARALPAGSYSRPRRPLAGGVCLYSPALALQRAPSGRPCVARAGLCAARRPPGPPCPRPSGFGASGSMAPGSCGPAGRFSRCRPGPFMLASARVRCAAIARHCPKSMLPLSRME